MRRNVSFSLTQLGTAATLLGALLLLPAPTLAQDDVTLTMARERFKEGVAYFDKGDYPRAIDDYTEALRIKPTDADALNNRAWTRYKAGDLDGALQDANRAITLDGTKAYIWDTRGHINEQRGAKSAAISDYRKALDLDKSSESSSEGLARLGATN